MEKIQKILSTVEKRYFFPSINSTAILFLLLFLDSCNYKTTTVDHSIIYPKIDTVLIDPNNKIVFLGDNFALSDIFIDSLVIYNLNSSGLAIEKINLGKKRLEKVILLEKEGPRGVGDWHIGLIAANDSLLLLEGDNTLFFLSHEGELIEKVRIDHLFYAFDELTGKNTVGGIFISGRRLFKIIKDDVSNEFSLLVYDIDEDKYKLLEIPLWHLVKSGSFVIEYPNGGKIISMKGFSIDKIQQSIMVSNRTYPQIVVYKNNFNETKVVNPISKFYAAVETVEEVPLLYSQEEANVFLAELENRMHFLPPIWDKSSNRIFRWGYKRSAKFNGDEDPEFDNYLFVIDSAFQMEKEYHFPQIRVRPHKCFLANNKIYLYKNFNDELGFIRVWLGEP